jgi:DNA-binding MarR family transcriptional regulator
MPNFRQALSAEEKKELRKLLAALEPFRTLRPTMPLQYVVAFLLVALEEGRGVGEYGRKAGVSQSVMSRHLLDIGDRNRYMEEGFGLITQRPDPLELRKHQVMLSNRGKAVAQQIVRVMQR